jgi:sugar lactone lactonase YvrE
VLVTTGDGKVVRQIAIPPDGLAPSGVAVDAAGKVFVADSAGPRLYAAAKDQATMAPITGSLREDMDFAGGLAVDGQKHVFVLDEHGGGIVTFGSDGSFRGRQGGFGWLDGQLRWPAALCVGESGFLAVADRENNRIVTFLVAP